MAASETCPTTDVIFARATPEHKLRVVTALAHPVAPEATTTARVELARSTEGETTLGSWPGLVTGASVVEW